MIIDGETYACEGCIRGHRARNCQHNDRPLQHIKAKGRPVSQCNHCRSERKNRSAHVKCQCGKRASEGGEDCGCFSGQKCRCATKKSPKQEPVKLGDISENVSELTSPTSTLNTASPAQMSTSADFQWSEAATPALNFTPLGGLAQFDPNSWITTNPQFDTTGGMDHGGIDALPTTGTDSNHLAPNTQQPFMVDMPDFANMADWPPLDDESTKQLLAMMDTPAGIDMNSFDASILHLVEGTHPNPSFGLDFSSIDQQPPPAQPSAAALNSSKCNNKREEGCGPCCG